MLHLDIGRKVIEVADGQIFMADLNMMAMLQRSYGVVDALIDAVIPCLPRRQPFVAAHPRA